MQTIRQRINGNECIMCGKECLAMSGDTAANNIGNLDYLAKNQQ